MSLHATRRARNGQRRIERERGIALIMVLGVLAIIGLMAGHIAVISETVDAEARVAAFRGELKYAAESGAERALWFHLVDRKQFPNRQLGRERPERAAEDMEAWMLDGKTHVFEDVNCRVSLLDALSGLDFSGANAMDNLRSLLLPLEDDGEGRAEAEMFLDILGDYIDTDSFVRLYGKEADEYRSEGHMTLPRDGPLQFREEVRWLDGWETVLSRSGPPGLIPPKGLSHPRTRQKQSRVPFFSSSAAELRHAARLTQDQIDQLVEARHRFQTLGEPLDVNLDPHLLQLAYNTFSFEESPVVTVVAEASSPTGEVKRTVRLSRDCRLEAVSAFSSNTRESFANWERTLF